MKTSPSLHWTLTLSVSLGVLLVANVRAQIGPGNSLIVINIGQNKIGTVTDNGGGSFTVVGGGNDIWDMLDEFTFAYASRTGDFDVRVRVESLTPNARWSKCGLMVRESLAEDSRMLFLRVTPPDVPTSSGGNGAHDTKLAYRTGAPDVAGENGGLHEDPGAQNPPPFPNAWLRLLRTGNVFSAQTSTDGTGWTEIARQDTGAGVWTTGGGPLRGDVLVGLACSRHSGGPTATAEFRDFAFTPLTPEFTLLQVSSRGNPNGILVSYSVVPDTGATEPVTYTIVPVLTITSVTPGPRPGTYWLNTVETLTEGSAYDVEAFGVTFGGVDLRWPENTKSFTHGPGYEAVGIHVGHNKEPSGMLATAQTRTAYERGLFSTAEGRPALESNVFFEDPLPDTGSNERFTTRVFGLLNITTAGGYKFAMSSDDSGKLYLGTGAEPANKGLIAQEPAWSGPREYAFSSNGGSGRGSPPTNQSATINLTPGRYYLELMFTESGDRNNGSVTWQPPGGPAIANGANPIPSSAFAPSRYFNGPDRGVLFTSLGPVQLVTQPAAQSGAVLEPVTFRVQVDGTPPYSYQWRRNGQAIAGANAASYTIPAIQPADDGAVFSVTVNNEFSTTTSVNAMLTVLLNPRIANCTSRGNCHAVYVQYNKPMRLDGVYTVVCSNTVSEVITPLVVTGLRYGSASNEVCLSVTPDLQPDTNVYCVTVLDGHSTDGLIIDPNPSKCCFVHGAEHPLCRILFERYDDVGNGNLTAFLNSSKYINHQPDAVFLNPTGFFETPTNIRDNYGGRIFGYYIAPQDGNYFFWMSSDDQGATYIATDADPAHKVQLCREPAWGGERAWADAGHDNNDNRGSPPVNGSIAQYPNGIPLAAGQRVYLEGLFTDGPDRDNYALTVRINDPSVPPNGFPPISLDQFMNLRLSPDGTIFSYLCDVVCVGGLRDATVCVGERATFSATPEGTPPYRFQWKRNGAPIPGATSRSYTIAAVVDADNGAVFDLDIANEFSTYSCRARLTVLSPRVTNLDDTGKGSLRNAIASGDSCGPITFAPTVRGEIRLTSGELFINKPLRIVGPGAALLSISGNNASRVFHITGGASEISNLRIANGYTEGAGGGIAVDGGALIVSNCAIVGCYADNIFGGGGIYAGPGTLSIVASTIQGNSSPCTGGGIGLGFNANAFLINSTVSGNRTGGGFCDATGGGIHVQSANLIITDSTIANNSSAVGGGIYRSGGTVVIRNSLIAGNNAPTGPDCNGTFVSSGYNLIGNTGGSAGFGATGDQLNVDPLLGPLHDNGGPTLTHALRPGSPAIDKGQSFGYTTDERGGIRPFDFMSVINASGGDGSDIGAFEVGSGELLTPVVSNNHDSGPGSLRQVFDETYSGGIVAFASDVVGSITLTSGELLLNNALTIVGPGAAQLSISGNNASRVFHIGPQGNVEIHGLTITEGHVVGANGANAPLDYPADPGEDARGGGILNEGTLRLYDCLISSNSVTGGNGGRGANGNAAFGVEATAGGSGGAGAGAAVYSTAPLELFRCTVLGNTGFGGAGGLGGRFSGSGRPGGAAGTGGDASTLVGVSARLENCTLAGNRAVGGNGGGGGSGSPSATGGAGGAACGGASGGAFILRSCTLSDNSASGGVGGTGSVAGVSGPAVGGLNTASLDLMNTLIAGNTGSTSPDLFGAVTSQGWNLIGITNSNNAWLASDLKGSAAVPLDPILGPVRDNGGPTPTMALLPGSPAIDQGKSSGLSTDQRRRLRPTDWPDVANASGGDGSDIGAFEGGPPAPSITRSGNQVVLSWPASAFVFRLQSADTLSAGNTWATDSGTPVLSGGIYQITKSISSARKFYRLINP